MSRPNSVEDFSLSGESEGDHSDTSDAVETIQAAMRGYMARQMAMKDLTRYIYVHTGTYVWEAINKDWSDIVQQITSSPMYFMSLPAQFASLP